MSLESPFVASVVWNLHQGLTPLLTLSVTRLIALTSSSVMQGQKHYIWYNELNEVDYHEGKIWDPNFMGPPGAM